MRYTYSTNNLALAAAILSVGIPLCEEEPFTKTKSHRGESYVFFFQAKSIYGEYDARDLGAAWDNPKWHKENPESPFAYIKCAFLNRERLLDKVNQSASLVVIEKGGKLAIISSNATEAFQNEIFAKL